MAQDTAPTRPATPPLAPGLPFVGSVLQLTQDSQGFFFDQYVKLGSVFRVRALGNEFKVLAGPSLNVMMATEPDAFSAWDIWEPLVNDFGGRRTLTMVDGPEHSRMRKLLRRSFSRSALMENIPQVVELVRDRLRAIEPGSAVPVVRLMQRLTADELGTLSNGAPPGEHFDDIVFWWNSLIDVYLSRRKSPASLQKEKYRRARARVRAFAEEMLAARGTSASDDPDAANFLDNLAAVSAQDPEFMSRDEALFLAMSPYFAGLDTVANVSSFMIYELLRQPELLARARREADLVFASGMPTEQDFRRMDVLHRVAMETLRLYPIAGVLPRKAARDFTFEGYRVNAGEFFMAATSAAHFSPHFYRDPHTFDIERYCESRNEHKTRGAYAPFGAGPHTCLGAGLAEVQIMLTMATLLHSVDFDFAASGYRLKKEYTPSMSPKGLNIRITRRRDAAA